MSEKTADEQQLEAEQAIAEGDEAERAAEKRAAALTARDAEPADKPADAKPKAKRQTTR